ncbi:MULTISPECIES: hypothetical protein [Streptococcus]|uniref:hypothetical protein n=1 Tax=Streptococcus TaxID=1301 RepID=UPI00160419CF|nr:MULTISPECIES: hypothetical protein [Streptococcus]DAO49583.1 MAG TPA: hypothetical protein [Caudoviricetes sp.]DAP95701.1 MAG TPA: hypothetical protein [Caudoviricetes sp.]DAS40494.1 MAG TPA: hypothetical protein [Caudoviricetes sp.]
MSYAYYCLHQFNWTPSFLDSLSKREKALIFAFIDIRVEAEEKEHKEMERKSKGRRRR